MKLIILGGGGHARIIIDIVLSMGYSLSEMGICDDKIEKGTKIDGVKVIGKLCNLRKYLTNETTQLICAIGDNQTRSLVVSEIKNGGFNNKWFNAVHPSAIISSRVKLGIGITICAGTIIQTNTIIGDHSIINTRTSIDHDSIIGKYVHVAPGCILCGTVKVGDYTFIGAGTTIINNITVGQKVIIGSHSNVIRNMPDYTKSYGNPAKMITNDRSSFWSLRKKGKKQNPTKNEIKQQIKIKKHVRFNQELDFEKTNNQETTHNQETTQIQETTNNQETTQIPQETNKQQTNKQQTNKQETNKQQTNKQQTQQTNKQTETLRYKFNETTRRKWPIFEPNEIEQVVEVLTSGKINYWTGNQVKLFEKEFAEYVGTKHAIALANGTLAIELALYAIGLEAGDEVIVTPRSFIASASSVVIRGGIPVFAEIDPDSQNITAETIREQITDRTKAVICVHLAGWPCQMDEINQLCHERGIYVIEDCAQAHGARYQDRPVGSWGDIACWSFCQDKIITTGGEGGMITLNDDQMYQKAWSYKDHGKDYQMIFHPEKNTGGYRRIYTSFGTNWRLTEMQAAIGREMLRRLDQMVDVRRTNADFLITGLRRLAGENLRIPVPEDCYHSYYRFYFFIENLEIRDHVIKELNQNGLPAFTGSCSELYLEDAFNKLWPDGKSLEISRRLGNESVALLVDHTVTQEMLEETLRVIEEVICRFTL